MLKTILFDMGNVLVYFSHERMVKQIAEVCGQQAESVGEFLLDSGLQWEFERGLIGEGEFHRRVEAFAGRDVDYRDLLQAGADIFWRNDSILPVLDGLKTLGVRLVVLSNTCASHFEFVRRRFDCLGYFDDFVLSCEVGAIKPEPAIYEAALERIACAPSECFYTDDVERNVEAARAFGLRAHVYTDADALVAQLDDLGLALPKQ
jgi:HAD superfamily hydrolase (TIGR01509 family)